MRRSLPLLLGLLLMVAPPAAASFHFMQIEQVLGAACGSSGQQAIQLRMRFGGQNLVSPARLYARDAAGNNPVLLLDFPGNVASGASGARVLVGTAALAASQGVTLDFTLTSPIPHAYLPAGKLTFEDDFGTIYWALAWGGAGYTGTNSGSTTNDADGSFSPPFGGALGNAFGLGILFPGSAAAASTNNAADYQLTAAAPTLTNNAGTAVALPSCVFGDDLESADTSAWSAIVP